MKQKEILIMINCLKEKTCNGEITEKLDQQLMHHTSIEDIVFYGLYRCVCRTGLLGKN